MIVFGGKVWLSINEPYCAVNVYGTRHNHGGTGISLNFQFKGVNVLVPEAFRIVPQNIRKASKEAEARVFAGAVLTSLAGDFNREDLREARNAFKVLDDMYTHGLETVER